MSNKAFASFLAINLGLLSACGLVKGSNSKLDGHYEDSSAREFERSAGLQRATAEWEDSQGVVISLPLIQSMGREDFAAAIASTSIDKLWITVPSTFTGTVASSPVFAKLRAALGRDIAKVELVHLNGEGLSVWARDWAPQGALTASGEVRLLDFNYYPNRESDDYTPRAMERVLNFGRVSVPVYNEGGNFMNTTDGHCMMTTRVSEANDFDNVAFEDDMVLNDDEISNYYKASAGCTKVTIFPRMPYEGTGHIDMWAKIMNDNTVIVSELSDELAQDAAGREIQAYYNERAADIAAMGYKVVRIPSLGVTSSGRKTKIYTSYTNSLLLNGEALVPRYVEQNVSASLVRSYEAQVEKIYKDLGYKFTWINSDDLIAMAGAVHCTTMQIPR